MDDQLCNRKAERALLGCTLIDPPSYRRVSNVPPTAFTSWKLTDLWTAIGKLVEEGTPIDYVTLSDEMEKQGKLDAIGGGAFLTGLVNAVPSAINVEQYAEIVLDYAERRADVNRAERLVKLAYDGDRDYQAERANIAQEILTGRASRGGLVDASEAADTLYAEISDRIDNPLEKGAIPDLETGLLDLDRVTGGLHAGLYAVAATTSTGKTALALNVAINIAKTGSRVAFFSPEMSPSDLMHRIVCAYARVYSEDLERGQLAPRQLEDVTAAFGWMADLPLVISQEDTMAGIEALVHRALPLDFIVLDGIELITGAGSDKMHQVRGETSRWAKRLADNPHVRCPVWLNMQVAVKEVKGRKNKLPKMGDIYGSSEPEFVTDNLLFLHREDAYEAPGENDRILDVLYLKCRKRRRRVPSKVSLFLDEYGRCHDASVHDRVPDDIYFGGD